MRSAISARWRDFHAIRYSDSGRRQSSSQGETHALRWTRRTAARRRLLPFCDPATVATALTTSEHFYLLADNAPLVEGHALIIPRDHYACFGALPAAWDDELLVLKGRVARFEIELYRPAIFFEHGVFGQTVYHAHLHAVPLGPAGWTSRPRWRRRREKGAW